MKKLISMLLVSCAFVMTGCSSLNVKPFADSTLAMKGAISTEMDAIKAEMKNKQLVKTLIANSDSMLCYNAFIKKPSDTSNMLLANQLCAVKKSVDGCKSLATKKAYQDADKNVCPKVSKKKLLETSLEQIATLFDEINNYTVELVNVAEAGKTGKESIASLNTNLTNIVAIAGVPASALAALGKEWVGKIANQVTIYQANKTIKESMEKANVVLDLAARSVEKELVPKLRKIYKSIYRAKRTQINRTHTTSGDEIIAQMGAVEQNLFAGVATTLKQYSKLKEPSQGAKICNENGDNCLEPGQLAIFKELHEFVEEYVEPSVKKYDTARAELESWKSQTDKNLKNIIVLTKVFAKEHKSLLKTMDKCRFGNTEACTFKTINFKPLFN